jgi:hypothetical protein
LHHGRCDEQDTHRAANASAPSRRTLQLLDAKHGKSSRQRRSGLTCDSSLATCTCTGAAAVNKIPVDKTSVVISPVNAGDPAGTVTFANYAAAPAYN